MTRPIRVVVPGMPLHVVQRGNNRCVIARDRRDFCFFLACLDAACKEYRCDVHAYVLMTNHVHLLMTPRDKDGPAKIMQSIGTRYVTYFNQRHERVGTLWQGRYRSVLVESEGYFLVCARYIELNPVRAGIVDHPAAYSWSSYGRNVLGRPDPLVREHPVFQSLGRTPAERRRAYALMFEQPIDESTLGTIRMATNKGTGLAQNATDLEPASASEDGV